MTYSRKIALFGCFLAFTFSGCSGPSDDGDSGDNAADTGTPAMDTATNGGEDGGTTRQDTSDDMAEDGSTTPNDTGGGGEDANGSNGDTGGEGEDANGSNGDTGGGEDANGSNGDTGGGMVNPSPDDFETVDCADADVGTTVEVGPEPGPDFKYIPKDVTVTQGKAVKWEWTGNTTLPHNVVGGGTCGSANSNWFESQTTSSSDTTFCVEFVGAPGTYEYQCSVGNHCSSGMKGTVTVEQ